MFARSRFAIVYGARSARPPKNRFFDKKSSEGKNLSLYACSTSKTREEDRSHTTILIDIRFCY